MYTQTHVYNTQTYIDKQAIYIYIYPPLRGRSACSASGRGLKASEVLYDSIVYSIVYHSSTLYIIVYSRLYHSSRLYHIILCCRPLPPAEGSLCSSS